MLFQYQIFISLYAKCRNPSILFAITTQLDLSISQVYYGFACVRYYYENWKVTCYIITNHYPKCLAVRFYKAEYYDKYDYTDKNSMMAVYY